MRTLIPFTVSAYDSKRTPQPHIVRNRTKRERSHSEEAEAPTAIGVDAGAPTSVSVPRAGHLTQMGAPHLQQPTTTGPRAS